MLGVRWEQALDDPGKTMQCLDRMKRITIDFGIWLATGEQNALVLELEAFRAGAMPIAAQSILQHITDAVKNNNSNVELNWYRNPATVRPCAVLRIQPDQPRPAILLQTVQLEKGRMVIGCQFNDGGSQRALLNLPGLALRDNP